MVGGRKIRRRDTPAAIYEEKRRAQVQLRMPALGGPAPRGPPAGRGGGRGWFPCSGGFVRRRAAPSPPASPIPPSPHPAAVAGSSGGGDGKRQGSGRVPHPALPPAGGRALGYPCAATGAVCGHRVTQTSRKRLTSVPSFFVDCQKSPRLDRSNMAH